MNPFKCRISFLSKGQYGNADTDNMIKWHFIINVLYMFTSISFIGILKQQSAFGL